MLLFMTISTISIYKLSKAFIIDVYPVKTTSLLFLWNQRKKDVCLYTVALPHQKKKKVSIYSHRRTPPPKKKKRGGGGEPVIR